MVKGSVVQLTILVNFDHHCKDNQEFFGSNFQQTSYPTSTTVFMMRQMEENSLNISKIILGYASCCKWSASYTGTKNFCVEIIKID